MGTTLKDLPVDVINLICPYLSPTSLQDINESIQNLVNQRSNIQPTTRLYLEYVMTQNGVLVAKTAIVEVDATMYHAVNWISGILKHKGGISNTRFLPSEGPILITGLFYVPDDMVPCIFL